MKKEKKIEYHRIFPLVKTAQLKMFPDVIDETMMVGSAKAIPLSCKVERQDPPQPTGCMLSIPKEPGKFRPKQATFPVSKSAHAWDSPPLIMVTFPRDDAKGIGPSIEI